MKFTHKLIATAALSMLGSAAFAQAGETVKIAWIDPLSGLMAPVGSKAIKANKKPSKAKTTKFAAVVTEMETATA